MFTKSCSVAVNAAQGEFVLCDARRYKLLFDKRIEPYINDDNYEFFYRVFDEIISPIVNEVAYINSARDCVEAIYSKIDTISRRDRRAGKDQLYETAGITVERVEKCLEACDACDTIVWALVRIAESTK